MFDHCPSDWILDTGATDHITCDSSLFVKSTVVENFFVALPNGHRAKVTTVGEVQLSPQLVLHGVLYVPSFHFNFCSSVGLLILNKYVWFLCLITS